MQLKNRKLLTSQPDERVWTRLLRVIFIFFIFLFLPHIVRAVDSTIETGIDILGFENMDKVNKSTDMKAATFHHYLTFLNSSSSMLEPGLSF